MTKSHPLERGRDRRWLLVSPACSRRLADERRPTPAARPPSVAATTRRPEGAEEGEFFVQADYDRQLALRDVEPEGPADKPWEQALEPEDGRHRQVHEGRRRTTSASPTPRSTTRGGRSASRPCRPRSRLHHGDRGVPGRSTPRARTTSRSPTSRPAGTGLRRADRLAEHHRDADPRRRGGVRERLPVIVFDRGVNTDCPVTFINPIGGYAFGADGAEFLVEKVKPGGKVLALRILPGVDVLETRWSRPPGDLRRQRAGRRRRRVHRRRRRQDQDDRQPTTSSATARSTASGWTPARPRSRPSRRSRTPASTSRRSSARTSRTSCSKWDEDGLTAIAPDLPDLPVAHADHRRR